MDPSTPLPATATPPEGLEQIMQALHKLTLDNANAAKSNDAKFERLNEKIDRISSSASSHSSTLDDHTSRRTQTHDTDGELVNDDGTAQAGPGHTPTGGIVQMDMAAEQSTPVNFEGITENVNLTVSANPVLLSEENVSGLEVNEGNSVSGLAGNEGSATDGSGHSGTAQTGLCLFLFIYDYMAKAERVRWFAA
jgi:hypothetical protein